MNIENNNMVSIYCIEDINGLKYVGSTKQKINKRLWGHVADKKRNQPCSSSKLDLDNCKIYSLETCNESERKERERYWINKIDCVNEFKLNGINTEKQKEYGKKYYYLNKEKTRERYKEYRKNNKEYFSEYQKEHREYQKSWGGDMRRNNNLLKIDISIFH